VKALFLGTSDFAVPSLRVTAGRAQLVAVVTQPDRRAGRGRRLTASPVKRAALELGLPVLQPVRLRPLAEDFADDAVDLIVLASYGRILPQELLALPRLGALNVHPSLLPRYRGATPIQSAILNGDKETGVSIMLMDAGLDTGDIVLQERVAIDPQETYGLLHDRLARLGAELLGRAIDLAADGTLVATPQTGLATLTKPLTKEDLAVDLSAPAQRVVDRVRAFAPQPAARATIDGEPVKILRAHVGDQDELVIDELIAPNRGPMSGEAYRRSRRGRT
jgi:methionyl-tRNA formyltransferase